MRCFQVQKRAVRGGFYFLFYFLFFLFFYVFCFISIEVFTSCIPKEQKNKRANLANPASAPPPPAEVTSLASSSEPSNDPVPCLGTSRRSPSSYFPCHNTGHVSPPIATPRAGPQPLWLRLGALQGLRRSRQLCWTRPQSQVLCLGLCTAPNPPAARGCCIASASLRHRFIRARAAPCTRAASPARHR